MTIEEFRREWESEKDYIEARTSGSTGAPKTIRLLKSDMVHSAQLTNSFFGISKTSKLALPLSLDYIAGKMMAVRSFIAHCELEIIEPSNRFDWSGSCDLISIVPTQVPWILENRQWASKTKNIIIGGAALPYQLKKSLFEGNYNAYCSYGMTETCSHVALAKLTLDKELYQAMSKISFDRDKRGCLVIKTPEFSFGSLITNDIVDLVDERHFYYRGRFDNVINSGGLKIHPEEVESLLSPFLGANFYIIGEKDNYWGEIVVLVVEWADLNFEKIMDDMRKSIDHCLLPKKIVVVRALPRTSTGKVKRIYPQSEVLFIL